ncbi:MAG: hypothetical protein RSE00_02335 [Clostridia bacterium]
MSNKKSSKKKAINNKVIKYIESVIYIISVIVAIFGCVYGNIYISMMPLLLVVGFAGYMLFCRSFTTTIFGIVMYICILYISGQRNLQNIFLYSSLAGLQIAFGELLGYYFKKIYFKKKNTSFKIRSENDEVNKEGMLNKLIYLDYLLVMVIIIIALIFHIYINGDIHTYKEAKLNVLKNIEETYKEDASDFFIIASKYEYIPSRQYSFEVLNLSSNYISKFKVLLKEPEIVYDGYREYILSNDEKNANNQLNNYLVVNGLKIKYSNLDIFLKCSDTQKFTINISKSVPNVREDIALEYAKQLDSLVIDLKDFTMLDKIKELEISLKDTNTPSKTLATNIFMENIQKKESSKDIYEYILNSLTGELYI